MELSDRFRPADLAQHREFLCRLARSLLRDAAQAEDVVQGAFALALERPPREPQGLGLWLRMVVRRLALNERRHAERLRAREEQAAQPEARGSTDDAAASLEIQELVLQAVRALEEPYRTTLWLRYYEDLSRREIAARESVPERTVQTRLGRGLERLRAELDRRSGGDRERWTSALLVLAREPGVPWIASAIGIGIMKKLVVVAGVLLALLLAWRQIGRSDAPPLQESARPQATEPSLADASVAAPARADTERAPVVPVVTPAAAVEATALLVRVVWAEDGTPAPDVGLIVRPEDDPRGERAVRFLRSDGDGLLRVAPIAPGRVRIEADRGGSVTADVRAGKETEVRFALAAGLAVEGTVSDGGGAPIAGAEVLLVADALDWLASRVVAHTAANGAYRIRAVQPEFSVSARAGGFAPALLRPLRGREGTVRLDFVLAEPGAGLRGIVRDPEGRAVAGALVAVGDPGGYAEDDPEQPGAWLLARGLCVEKTDADGRFFAPGARTGFGLSVAVQAESYPIAVANVSAEAGTTAFVEIRLAAPATLSGTVRTSAGEPAAGVRMTTVLCDGANEVPFALPAATSDAEGRYRIALLPRRSVLRLAPAPSGGATTLVSLALEPGETSRDLVLAADDTVRGRVEVQAGLALDGWYVVAHQQFGGGRLKRADVDASGRFELPGCDHGPYRIELYAATDRPALRVEDIGPGPELVLVPPLLGVIRGEFVDEAGLATAGAQTEIGVSYRDFVTLPPSWEEHGRFVFERLRPGRYRFTIAWEEQVLCARTVELAPGADLDLGRIASAPPGSLVVAFDPPPDEGVSGTVLDDGGGEVAALGLADGRLGVAQLPPGNWSLELEARGRGRILAPFAIRAGERTELPLHLLPGVQRSLAFDLRRGTWETLRVELRDSRGELVLAKRIRRRYWPAAGDGPSLLVTLAVGTYALEASTDDGRVVRTSFDVPALTPQEAPLVFELR